MLAKLINSEEKNAPVDERIDNLLLDDNAGVIASDGADGLAEETISDGEDVRLVDNGHGGGSLWSQTREELSSVERRLGRGRPRDDL